MLKLFPQGIADCERIGRRRFMLEVGALSGFGITLDSFLRQQAAVAGARDRGMNGRPLYLAAV